MTSTDADVLAFRVATQLAGGTITCGEAAGELRLMSNVSPKCIELVHFLYHYVTDEDIRARDEEYAKWQQQQLRRLIAEAT
jgi:hypothetical protein